MRDAHRNALPPELAEALSRVDLRRLGTRDAVFSRRSARPTTSRRAGCRAATATARSSLPTPDGRARPPWARLVFAAGSRPLRVGGPRAGSRAVAARSGDGAAHAGGGRGARRGRRARSPGWLPPSNGRTICWSGAGSWPGILAEGVASPRRPPDRAVGRARLRHQRRARRRIRPS